MFNGRTLPIQEIANKIKQYQMQLPRISNWQCYHQLLEAMDAPLLQAVRPFINEDMEWEKLIEQCEIHNSVRRINKNSSHNFLRPRHQPRLQSKPFVPTPTTNMNSTYKPPHRFDRNRKPAPTTSRFTALTPKDREEHQERILFAFRASDAVGAEKANCSPRSLCSIILTSARHCP